MIAEPVPLIYFAIDPHPEKVMSLFSVKHLYKIEDDQKVDLFQ